MPRPSSSQTNFCGGLYSLPNYPSNTKFSETKARQPNPDRRCFRFGYMGDAIDFYYTQFVSLQFPPLETASLGIPKHADSRYRLQYLIPNLRVLKISDHYQEHNELMNDDCSEFESTS